MKVLFIIGSNLKVNNSANLCHLAYIKGCLDNKIDVDVLTMGDKGSNYDESIKLPKVRNWFFVDPPLYNKNRVTNQVLKNNTKKNILYVTKEYFKKLILRFYGVYGRTSILWSKKAKKFKSDEVYDYIISLATPYVSHFVANCLIEQGHLKYDKWIQIWEDPWSLDLYNIEKNRKKEQEEEKLLKNADIIYYVSPLTLEYQKKLFPKYAKKMKWHPLPYYYKKTNPDNNNGEIVFGYYGDYMSFSRNIMPFYKSANKMNIKLNVFGNSDLSLLSNDKITIKPRVDLKELELAENKTDVLVFLSNLSGGQIPGKIYQYSATDKTILFILDGTDNEKKVLKNYFNKFNRYVFCENNENSIQNAIKNIIDNNIKVKNECIESFSPKNAIRNILELK